jgi:acyl transferase domain-containing protein
MLQIAKLLSDVILDSAASLGLSERTSTTPDNVPRLAVYSSNDGNCAKSGLDALQQYLGKQPVEAADLAYTLGRRREHHAHRSFAVMDGAMTPVFSAPSKVPKISPEIAFVFTGQGAQWATMGASLIADYPSVALDMDSMDLALSRLPEPPTWTIQCKSIGLAAMETDHY